MNLQELKKITSPLCARHKVARLDLFGSYAKGTETPASDVDFCVSFQQLPAAEYSAHYFGFLHDLEDALGLPIDLLTEQSIKRETLRNNINNRRVPIYG